MGQAANHSSRFQGCTRLRSAPKLSTVNATSTSDMFKDCVLLRYIDWDGFDTSSNKNFGSMFSGCSSLQSIPELDCSSNTSTYSSYGSPMSGCYALKDFGGLKGINKSIYFDRDYCLSYESLLNIINGLASGVSGQTLTLNEDLVNQLSDDDIAIATNKG